MKKMEQKTEKMIIPELKYEKPRLKCRGKIKKIIVASTTDPTEI